MALRKKPLITGELYHIYNRGVEKRQVFLSDEDNERFLQSLVEFNVATPIGSIYENSFRHEELSQLGSSTPKLVEIVSYCLNRNHFHLLLRQVHEDGISKFMQKVGTGYTNYFNERQKRSGALFQGRFKAKHVDSNDYLLRLFAYINLNSEAGVSVTKSELFRSSWKQLLGQVGGICENFGVITEQFSAVEEMKLFALDALEDIKANKVLENERKMFEGE